MSLGYSDLLVIPRLKVHNANAFSSPYTIGFPAMTAWLGFVHALQRHINQFSEHSVNFSGVGIVSHEFNLQTFQGENDFVASVIGTANPLDSSGKRSPFIEEPRCHLNASIVIECNTPPHETDLFLECIQSILNTKMKLAGGDILEFEHPYLMNIDNNSLAENKKFLAKLMPGYAILERRELMVQAMNEGQDAIDALIDHLALHYKCEVTEGDENNKEVNWTRFKKTLGGNSGGWLVPLATGFQGISELGEAKNQRDSNTPHRFAESAVSIGEFKMPYRLDNVQNLFWRYKYQPEQNLYLCTQQDSYASEESSFEEF